MLYVLAYPVFTPELTASIDRFRSLHEPERAQLVRPHVTLVFGVTGVEVRAFSQHLEVTLEGRKEIPIDFDRLSLAFDPFEGTYKLMLLCRRGCEAITALHRQLYHGAGPARMDPDHPFRPHMTVAANSDREALARIDASTLARLPLQAMLGTVELVERSGKGLETLRRFQLRS